MRSRPAVSALVATTALALALAGCGTSGDVATDSPGSPTPTPTPSESEPPAAPRVTLPAQAPAAVRNGEQPPRFHLLTDSGSQLTLRPYTYCYGSMCADGAPIEGDLPSVGAPTSLVFGFDLEGWRFREITFHRPGRPCGPMFSTEAVRTGPREFEIPAVVPAGVWAVDIFGRGEDGGDAVTTVEWNITASSDGQRAERVPPICS